MNRKMFYILFGLFLLIVGGYILFSSSENSANTQEKANQNLIPAEAITHGHGLSVDVSNPSKLYIATHHGLMVLINDNELYNLGKSKDDYMGFSSHPTDSKILYSSGHPESGGNIGFQKSEDSGFTWKKISDGVNGPVDFHAMAVSRSNPKVIYGWYQGALQRTGDEGRNWNIINTTSFPVVNLAVDPKNENKIYAASPHGLMLSQNAGLEWNTLFEGYVSALAIKPTDAETLLVYSEKYQLAQSIDGGKNWDKIDINLGGEIPLYISYSPKQPEDVYLITEKNSIYKSSNNATTWKKIR